MSGLAKTGCLCFEPTPASVIWADAALKVAEQIAADPVAAKANLRHGETWFVGVDALPNAVDGSVEGVPLAGAWEPHLPLKTALHRAQLSIIYPGYPKRDPEQSPANHRFRKERFAAHMDGLLPAGPEKRRFAREFHAYILGIQLGTPTSAPLVHWPGSHVVLGHALRAAVGQSEVENVDLTDTYVAARKQVFDTIKPEEVNLRHGGAVLLHRFALHGTAPWDEGAAGSKRIMAFFRPEFPNAKTWLDAL